MKCFIFYCEHVLYVGAMMMVYLLTLLYRKLISRASPSMTIKSRLLMMFDGIFEGRKMLMMGEFECYCLHC